MGGEASNLLAGDWALWEMQPSGVVKCRDRQQAIFCKSGWPEPHPFQTCGLWPLFLLLIEKGQERVKKEKKKKARKKESC